VKLHASAARLHGPALVRVWFVSDPRLASTNPLDPNSGRPTQGECADAGLLDKTMSHPRTMSFDGRVLRIDLGELAKDGRKIRLQDQPLQILAEPNAVKRRGRNDSGRVESPVKGLADRLICLRRKER